MDDAARRNIPAWMGVLGAVIGPAVGFVAMLVIWSVVGSEGRGGIDFGVVALGGIAAALPVLGAGLVTRQPGRSISVWMTVAFAGAVLIGLLAIAAYLAVFGELGDELGKVD